MKCRFGNCTARRVGMNKKTGMLYSSCAYHRAYQNNYWKTKRRLRQAHPETHRFMKSDKITIIPNNNVKIKELEAKLHKFSKLLEEVNNAKNKLNTLDFGNIMSEKEIRDIFAERVNGKTEHVLPSGDRIDVVTNSTIFEIKSPEQYKSGIGQLSVYGQYFPAHKKVLVLTKICTPNKLEHILRDCRNHDIFVELYNI